jgi:hypothetical protein
MEVPPDGSEEWLRLVRPLVVELIKAPRTLKELQQHCKDSKCMSTPMVLQCVAWLENRHLVLYTDRTFRLADAATDFFDRATERPKQEDKKIEVTKTQPTARRAVPPAPFHRLPRVPEVRLSVLKSRRDKYVAWRHTMLSEIDKLASEHAAVTLGLINKTDNGRNPHYLGPWE